MAQRRATLTLAGSAGSATTAIRAGPVTVSGVRRTVSTAKTVW
ncbi:hypothetical protein [Streptomyces sp. NPDC001307]